MSLDLGELRASVVVDGRAVRPGLEQAERNLRDSTRRIDQETRRAGEQAGRNLGDGIGRGGLARLRGHLREYVAVGREFGGGIGDGMREAFPRGLASVGDRLKSWGRQQLGEAQRVGRGIGGHLGDGVKSGVGMMGGALRTGSKLLAGFAVGGVASLGLVAGAAAAIGGNVATSNEQATISFTTMLRKAGDTEKEARDRAVSFIGDLQKLAATTPFEFADLQDSSAKLVSAGIDAQKIIPIMKNLGDVTSGVGTGKEGIERATVALQQMIAAQKISAEDLNQLRDAGLPVYDLLAGATGKSKKEISELAQSGKLGKDELDKLLKTLGDDTPKGLERFNGLMSKQSTSLKGMWSNLSDTVSQGLGRVGARAMTELKRGLAGVQGVATDLFTYLDKHGDSIERIFSSGRRALETFWGIVKPVMRAFTGSVTDGQDVLDSLADWLDTHQEDLTSWFVAGVDGAIGFGKALASAASLGLRAYAGLADGVGAALDFILKRQKAMVDDAAAVADVLGFGGTADKLRGVSGALQTAIDNNTRDDAGAGAARAMADVIDHRLVPGLDAAKRGLREYGDEAKSAARRSDAWQGALQGVTHSVEENGRSLSDHTEKGRANRKAIEGAVRALNDDAQAAYDAKAAKGDLKGAEKAAAKVIRDGTDDIRDQARKAKLNKGAVDDLIDSVKKIPKTRSTDINFSTNASKVLVKLRAQWGSAQGQAKGDQALKNSDKNVAAYGGLAGRFMGTLPGRTPLHVGDDMALPLLGGGRQHLRGGEGVQVTEAMDPYEKRRLDAMNHGVLAGESPAQVRARLGEGESAEGHGHGLARGGTVPSSVLDIAPAAKRAAEDSARATAEAYAAATRATLQRVLDASRSAASAGLIDVSNPTGHTTWRGGTFTNLFAANLRRAEGMAHTTIPVIQGGFRPATSYSGTSHRGDAIDTRVNYTVLRAMRAVGIATGDRTSLGNWAPHMHAVPTKGAGYAGGSGVWQAQDYLRRGGASQSPKSPWGLAHGGLVPYSPVLADLARANAYAAGTGAAARGFGWTAEKGAELVVNPQLRRYDGAEKVLTADQTRRALGRSGPLIDTVYITADDGSTRNGLQQLDFAVRAYENLGR